MFNRERRASPKGIPLPVRSSVDRDHMSKAELRELFGSAGTHDRESLSAWADNMERLALHHMIEGTTIMKRATSGYASTEEVNLAQRHFAIVGAVGGFINARINAFRLRTEVAQDTRP